MPIENHSYINFLSDLSDGGKGHIFFVDASNSMLLQKASFGDWSRAEAAIQLIIRQISSLSRAGEKAGNHHFLLVGFNSCNAVTYSCSPKTLLDMSSEPDALASFFLSEMKRLGGSQNTNRGLALTKKVLDGVTQNTSLVGCANDQAFLNKIRSRGIGKGLDINFYLFTDAEDASQRDLENPFAGYDHDPLVGIFVGRQRNLSGRVALRQILSKCQRHGEKRLFSLDGFKSFSELESAEFLSFRKGRKGSLCPSCLKIALENGRTERNKPVFNVLKSEELTVSHLKRSRKRITAELLVSAGPRKDDDLPLGEDAGGVIVESSHASFWVADGTSESPVLLDFSSRTMAQELGIYFVEEIGKITKDGFLNRIEHDPFLSSTILKKAFSSLFGAWQKRASELLESENARKAFDTAFKLDDRTAELTMKTHLDFVDFSTTFLGGFISGNGTGQAACVGDCPLCVGVDKDLHVYRLSNNRIFLRLRRLSDGYRFDRPCISEDISAQSFSNASLVIAGSDGVGLLPEFLKEQMKFFSWPVVRNRIHKFIPNSHDDKTFCVIHLG